MRIWLLLAVFLAGCSSGRKVENLPPEKEGVRETVNNHVADVADCYSAAVKRTPKLAGKVVLEWEINPIGDTKSVKVVEAVDRYLDGCLVQKVSKWTFAPPPDGKVMKVKYPFDFSPILEEAPAPKAATETENARAKICPQIENAYAENCVRDEKTNECIFDDKRMGEILKDIRESPKFDLAYLAELDRVLKAKKPNAQETKNILEKMAEDCWTQIHERMWASVFYSFKNGAARDKALEAKDVLRYRLVGLEVPTPTLSGLSYDLKILERAEDSGLIKPTGRAKKDIVFIRSRVKSLVKSLGREWRNGETSNADYNESLSKGILPDKYLETKVEGLKLVKLSRKELKAVKPIRAQLKDWVKKYWRKF